jgi:hypothetical protein
MNENAGYTCNLDIGNLDNRDWFSGNLDYLVRFYDDYFSYDIGCFSVKMKDGKINMGGHCTDGNWERVINGEEMHGLKYDPETNIMTFTADYEDNHDIMLKSVYRAKVERSELEKLPTLIEQELDRWRKAQNS